QDKSAGSGFERCEATARRVAGRKARHKLPGIKQAKKPHAKAWGFLFSAVCRETLTGAGQNCREQCCTARRAARHTTASHEFSQKPVLMDCTPKAGLFAFLSRYKAFGLLSSNLSVCSDNIKACRSPLITIFHFIPVQALALIPKTTRRKKT
ncbi:hypothetical protein ACB376_02195, partial [Klebsiella electrica]